MCMKGYPSRCLPRSSRGSVVPPGTASCSWLASSEVYPPSLLGFLGGSRKRLSDRSMLWKRNILFKRPPFCFPSLSLLFSKKKLRYILTISDEIK